MREDKMNFENRWWYLEIFCDQCEDEREDSVYSHYKMECVEENDELNTMVCPNCGHKVTWRLICYGEIVNERLEKVD